MYASRPQSPTTPQHALPGGRYPLPGPDFHRLDRASFVWRTQTDTEYSLDRQSQAVDHLPRPGRATLQVAGFISEMAAGFGLECVAGFVGICNQELLAILA